MSKLLSVIVPSCNMETYLPTCLGSLLGDERLRSALDVIVVNDGSTDRTSALAHDCAGRHPDAVRAIDKPNGHYGSAVNAGLAAANSPYVKILDADDTFDAAALLLLLAQIEHDLRTETSVDLYLTAFDQVDGRGTSVRTVSYDLPADGVFGLGEILAKTKEISMHACTWRTGLLREIGYRQTEGIAYSDVEWILYPMLRTRAVRYLPARVYRYLLGRAGQSVSLVERRRNTGAWEVILARIFAEYRARGAGLSPDARDYLLRVATDMARMDLEASFVLKGVGDAAREIPKLLADLEALRSGLAARLKDEARILKSTLNVPYLRIWCGLPVGRTLWMRLVRGYLRVTRWIG